MSKINIRNANLKYFKPVVNSRHNLTFKWLIDSGYTVGYLCLCLGIRKEDISGYFREPFKFKLSQIQVIIVLLKDIKQPSEILKTFMLPIDANDTKLNESLKTLYTEIALPVPTRSAPMHRLDYEVKKPKE